MIPNPFHLLLVTWANQAVDALTVAAVLAAVFCFAMAAVVEMKDRQERRREVPPAPEAPTIPRRVRDHLAEQARRDAELRVAYVARRQTKVDKAIAKMLKEVGCQ